MANRVSKKTKKRKTQLKRALTALQVSITCISHVSFRVLIVKKFKKLTDHGSFIHHR